MDTAPSRLSDEEETAGLLACRDVTVAYAGLRALSSVTFSVRRGEVVGLIGPNGAGKTTLVNAMSGFAHISEGSIRLAGAEVSAMPPERRAHLGLARTFQHGRLFGDLTVRENVELGAIAVGLSAREARRRADVVLEEVELLPLAATSTSDLSHGDQQRVSVARAVVAGPAFLLLDEPAAGMPAESLGEFTTLIEQTRTVRHAGVVVIDHNVEFVLGLSDRVVVLDHGQVLAEGTPSYVRQHEEVLAAYFGSVPESDVPGGEPEPAR